MDIHRSDVELFGESVMDDGWARHVDQLDLAQESILDRGKGEG